MTRVGGTSGSGNIPPTPSREVLAGSESASSAAKGVPCTVTGSSKKLNDDRKVSLTSPPIADRVTSAAADVLSY